MLSKFCKGDYVKFIGREGHAFSAYVNVIMEKYLYGKIFRVRNTYLASVEIDACELTENRAEVEKNMKWSYTTDMFELYDEPLNPQMDFSYEQFLKGVETRE